MNTRASQIELPKSAESFSDGAASFTSRPDWSVDPSSAISDRDQTQGELLDSVCDFGNGVLANADSPEFEWVSQPLPQSVWSRILFSLIGILLSATAIAKLWMLLTDSFADIRVGLPKEILWLSVAFEFWLAYENFRLRDDRVMAFVNTLVFASFAIFASVRLAMGYASCGCSGSLEIPAWVFVLIDVWVVAWFSGSIARRNLIAKGLRHLLQGWSSWSPEQRGRLAGLGIVASLIIGIQLPFASPLRTMILGELPIQAVVRIDSELGLNQETSGEVKIHNRSGQPAKIIGISRSCRCFDLVEDPISKVIPADGSLPLSLVVRPNRLGPLHQRVVLFLDHPKQFRMNVDVFGSVKGKIR